MSSASRPCAKRLGTVTVGDSFVDGWIVIRTDEVARHEVLAKGFEAVPDDLTDAECWRGTGAPRLVSIALRRLAEN